MKREYLEKFHHLQVVFPQVIARSRCCTVCSVETSRGAMKMNPWDESTWWFDDLNRTSCVFFIWEVSNTGPSRVQPETRSFWIPGVVSSGWWSLQEAGPAEDHSSVNIYCRIMSFYTMWLLWGYDWSIPIYTDLYWSMLYTYVLVFVWSIEGGSCVKSLLHSILDGKYPVMLIHWRAFPQSYGKKTGFDPSYGMSSFEPSPLRCVWSVWLVVQSNAHDWCFK